MPATSTATNPHNVNITFTEADHRYSSIVNGREIEYISVSTLAGKYFLPFNADEMAPRSAKKLGLTVEEVKAKWTKAGQDACRLGTRVHEVCEDVILGREVRNVPENSHEELLMDNGIKMANKFKDQLDIIGVEKLVFNEHLGIAGTIDLLAKSKKDGAYLILDWKTNKSIDRENKYGKYGLNPISHLDDTNFEHYSLQLSLYEFILKNTGYVPNDAKFRRAIVHLSQGEPEIIQLPDRTKEVKDIILEHLSSPLI